MEQKRGRGDRRAGNRARRGSGDDALAAPAHVTRKIPWFEFLSEEGLARIESQAGYLTGAIGLEFRDDPIALEIWRRAGADVQGTRVRLDLETLRALCSTAPEQFVQHARNPQHSVTIGGTSQVFAPVYGPPFVRDLEKGRRYGSIEDFRNLVKLTSMLPHLHHSGFVTCEPCDIPVNQRHLDMLYTHMRYSDKAFLGAITARERAEESVEMARILFGREFFDANCVIMGNVNTNSPLYVDKVVTEAIRTYSAAGQGMIVAPFILGGAMGPVTTAASIAQAFAEAVMCCAFTQLVRPGAPFVLGNFLSSMNLRSGAPTFGMPEPVASNYIIGQLARRWNLPLRCGGSLTASKVADWQAAAESADSMHSTALGGANFVLHAAGWLEGGLVTGYEKLILDHDRLGAYAKLLGGVALDDNALGREAYGDVEPAGHFLGSAHTLANYQDAYYEAELSDSNSFEQWSEDGARDAERRAYERWNRMLAEYQAPAIDESRDDELRAYIARKKESREDAWY